MTSHLPAFDLSRVHSLYPDPVKKRAALVALGRASLLAERWEDLMRLAKELVKTATQATPGADLTPEERNIFFTATKQVRREEREDEIGQRRPWRTRNTSRSE